MGKMEKVKDQILTDVTRADYKYGFVTDIETDTISRGLNEMS
jgi:Fe-S cluster assembly protein SufB